MLMPRNTIFAVILLFGGIFLQIHLSKKESKTPGLILPAISFVLSLFITFAVIGGLGEVITAFLLANLPTGILLGIYFSCREKLGKNKELE